MQKILTIIAVITMAITALAQKPLATLSHNGQLTLFDNNNCFEDALAKAENGDTIFLSAGDFISNNSEVTIEKRVAIIGCGYDSRILPKLVIHMEYNPNSYMEAPMFDGVSIQSLYFADINSSKNNLEDVKIQNCRIKKLENVYAGKEILIDRCFIEHANFFGASDCATIVQNSKIGLTGQHIGFISVIHCNIGKVSGCPLNVITSIIADSDKKNSNGGLDLNYGSHATLCNSLFPKGTNFSSISKLDTIYEEEANDEKPLLDENLECTINLKEKGYLGTDGTVIGIYGGVTPYTVNPSVPTVDAANSSVEYDKENNKLNVKITVTPN